MTTLLTAVDGLKGLSRTTFFLIGGIMIFLSACSKQYHITESSAKSHVIPDHTRYFIMEPSTGTNDDKTLLAITSRLEKNFTEMGMKKDSLDPELFVLVRGETHPVSQHSVRQTYSITNPVYSPFENTSDRLKSTPAPESIGSYETEFFFRVQAIDAVKNELVWSVKIYPHNRKGITEKNMTRLLEDLVNSFTAAMYDPNTRN